MELYRKDYERLKKWKAKPNKNPLVIDGLRQVGKSYLAKLFGKNEYEDCVFFDFRYDGNARNIFSKNGPDQRISVDLIIQRAKAYFIHHKIEPHKTLLIFDEINDCPEARESLKLFTFEHGYDVIATGSLLGLSDFKVKNIPAGYDDYLTMKAMDFEEFLLASKVSNNTIQLIYDSIKTKTHIDDAILNILHSYFIRYIIVGGMPKAVVTYLETNDLMESRSVLTNLLKDYLNDFGTKYKEDGTRVIDERLFIKTSKLFSSIHLQLAKEGSKKFRYKDVEGGGRSDDFSTAITWLEKTGMIVRCFNVSAIETPLSGNYYDDRFKIYFPDIGMLVASYPATLTSEILNGNLGAYKGAIYESIAADMFYKAGIPLFYYENTLKHQEVDFLVENKEGIDIYEVKATNGKMAFSKAIAKSNNPYAHQIKTIYKLIDKRYGQGDFFSIYPRFLLGFKMNVEADEIAKSLKVEPLPKI